MAAGRISQSPCTSFQGHDAPPRGVLALSSEPMPPIDELIRIEPIYLGRLERQGIFTTGLLLEVTETPTRRQNLADQVGSSTNDVLMWRDEAQMLNLAGFGAAEHRLLGDERLVETLGELFDELLQFHRTCKVRGECYNIWIFTACFCDAIAEAATGVFLSGYLNIF